MTDDTAAVLDENTRRYYLDAMGIQCWSLIDSPEIDSQREIDNAGDVADMVSNGRDAVSVTYADLEKAIQSCTNCKLHETRKQAITGRGKLSAELMFVVLSPDASDDKSGALCGGEANILFSKMLAAININVDDVYISSLLKCAVPLSHTISAKEIQLCNNYLFQQIQLIQPKLLVVLGETAVRCLLQKDLSIDDFREMNNASSREFYPQLKSLPLFVSYSPDELLQQPENKRKAWSDLQQLQKIMDKMK